MKNLIHYNWLILSVAAALVGIYIAVFEHILYDKGYLYFIFSLVFFLLYFRKRKSIKA